MALTEITKIDQIEITENNDIQVRTATIILKDDVELTRTFHRHVLSQGDDITNEDSKVITIANAIWV
jgi:urease accessory protein UreE